MLDTNTGLFSFFLLLSLGRRLNLEFCTIITALCPGLITRVSATSQQSTLGADAHAGTEYASNLPQLTEELGDLIIENVLRSDNESSSSENSSVHNSSISNSCMGTIRESSDSDLSCTRLLLRRDESAEDVEKESIVTSSRTNIGTSQSHPTITRCPMWKSKTDNGLSQAHKEDDDQQAELETSQQSKFTQTDVKLRCLNFADYETAPSSRAVLLCFPPAPSTNSHQRWWWWWCGIMLGLIFVIILIGILNVIAYGRYLRMGALQTKWICNSLRFLNHLVDYPGLMPSCWPFTWIPLQNNHILKPH